MTVQLRSDRFTQARLFWLARFSLLCLVVGLSACSTLPAPGLAASVVERDQGAPSSRAALAGGERWIYTRTYAQENLTVEFDPAGKVVRSYNGLTDQNFAQIQTGNWRKGDVFAAFGQPNERGSVGWGEHKFEVWSYRYKQSGTASMLMGVHFDAAGVVAKSYAYPDPAFEPNDKSRD